jgi:hypothetical protein
MAAQPPKSSGDASRLGLSVGRFAPPVLADGEAFMRRESRTLKHPAEGPRLRRGRASCGRDGTDNDPRAKVIYSATVKLPIHIEEEPREAPLAPGVFSRVRARLARA